jgi:hypothetical protein
VTVLHSVLSLQHEGLLASPTTLKKNDTKMIVIQADNILSTLKTVLKVNGFN